MGSFTFKNNRYKIKDYENCKPFSSFLPGISGISGIPMWTFYVNRGQGMSGFGVQDKDHPMMEFSPAAIAYKDVYTRGFRTFVRNENGSLEEPFGERRESQTMEVSMDKFVIEEERGMLRFRVEYVTVPQASFAGVLRKLTVTNRGDSVRRIECLDGIPEIIPYGVTNEDYKAIGNLLRSWMSVENLEMDIPYFTLRASTEDEAEVKSVERGHFALSWNDEGTRLSNVVDMERVFGLDTSLRTPEGCRDKSFKEIMQGEMTTANKLPGYFTGVEWTLQVGESASLYTLLGHTSKIEAINAWAEETALAAFAESCFCESKKIVEKLTDDMATKTANPIFDQYCRQSYLDNIMRGGYPVQLGLDEEKSFYVYSRKHGDQERDYNFFSISPEYYSQGNGNFRDVNQNRRNDVFFHPEIASHNIRLFFDLIQLDGYNPLVIEGQFYKLEEERFLLLKKELPRLDNPFTPGQLLDLLLARENDSAEAEKRFREIISQAQGEYRASHGEGFWSDHWTYNLDLIEGYLRVYPDRLESLLLEEKKYRFFDSPYRVLPRELKIMNTKNGLRQYGSIELDQEKLDRHQRKASATAWVCGQNGKGQVVQVNLMAKLISLMAMKFSVLDPMGLGLEMEAGKPGWNDALNGLPGLFGSSMAEQVELTRLVHFVSDSLGTLKAQRVEMPKEIADHWTRLMKLTQSHLEGATSDYEYWDCAHTLLEEVRDEVRFGLSGESEELEVEQLQQDLQGLASKLEAGQRKAIELGEGLIPTFFTFSFSWREIEAKDIPLGERLELVECHPLPTFLEAPARMMKTMNWEEGAVLHRQVKASELYDHKLGMMKTSVPIGNESMEIGRIRAFTPGWFERESVFLHMSYKYMLALLQSGQYDAFFKDANHALIPFLDPNIYGRPTTENVSFIASSANPDVAQHGRGHVARLSGSTAEFIHMWILMMAGSQPFYMEDNELRFQLNPSLPEWLFDENDEVRFQFMRNTEVVYQNPSRSHTYGDAAAKVVGMRLFYEDGSQKSCKDALKRDDALALREGRIIKIITKLA